MCPYKFFRKGKTRSQYIGHNNFVLNLEYYIKYDKVTRYSENVCTGPTVESEARKILDPCCIDIAIVDGTAALSGENLSTINLLDHANNESIGINHAGAQQPRSQADDTHHQLS